MLELLEDANEDSAASIVEERRFEDGQPAKIRLRYQWSKLLKQLSSSSSSPSPQRNSVRTLSGSPDVLAQMHGKERRGGSPSAASPEDRKSRYVVTSCQPTTPPTTSTPPAEAPQGDDSASLPRRRNAHLSSPPTPLPHTPPRTAPSTPPLSAAPPPPPPTSQLRVVLPERHSKNPLFAESEEEEKAFRLGDLPPPPDHLKPESASPSFHSPSSPPPPPPPPLLHLSSPSSTHDLPSNCQNLRDSHRSQRVKKPPSEDSRGHSRRSAQHRQSPRKSRARHERHPRSPSPSNGAGDLGVDDDEDDDDNDEEAHYLRPRSPSSTPTPRPRRASRRDPSRRRSSADLERVYPTTARLAAARISFDDHGHVSVGDGGDLADFLWQHRERRGVDRSYLASSAGELGVNHSLRSHSDLRQSTVEATSTSAAPLVASAALVPLDGASTLEALIAENDEMKEKIEKLKKELKEKDVQMQSLKLDAAMREAESDSRMASRLAEVVDELCAAQKERDATVTLRLRELERQRDAAIDERGGVLRRRPRCSEGVRGKGHYEDGYDDRRLIPFYYSGSNGVEDDDDDYDVSAKELTMQFRRRVEEVEAEKRRAEQIVEAEIKAAVEERDQVLGKCRIMREEMERMKRKSKGQSALERRLAATTQERDAAFAKLRILESKIQDADIDKGLLQSLSRENSLSQDLKLLESQAEDREYEIRALKSEKSILAEELRRALEEKEEAQAESRRARKESDAMRDNAVLLERLVRKLRDKLERRDPTTNGREGASARLVDQFDVGSAGGSSFETASERSSSRRGSLTSNASVSRATNL